MAAAKVDPQLQKFYSELESNSSSAVELMNLVDLRVKDGADKIVICEQIPPQIILKCLLAKEARHYVQKGAISFDKELNTSLIMISRPDLFFTNPVKAILNPVEYLKGINFVNNCYIRKFTSLSEKYDVLSESENFVGKISRSGSFVNDVQSIVDELVTNAIFHANDVENRKNEMDDSKEGVLYLANDSERMLIACRDMHGKLDVNKHFERIHTCYENDVSDKINMGKGGAGIGSYMVQSMSTSYLVGVKENVQTVIAAILPLNMSNRNRVKVPKNLHCIVQKG
jgi:hypothetical protein